jgi:hypothetical protein
MKHFKGQAIIFEKDGTLIDFDAMWGGWVLYLAARLHIVTGFAVGGGKIRDIPHGVALSLDNENYSTLESSAKTAERAANYKSKGLRIDPIL